MSRNDTTSAIIDTILRTTITGSALAAGIAIPNLLVALDKPLNKYLDHLDKKARERELRRVVSYMKSNRLLRGDYQHGLHITAKGRERLDRIDLNELSISQPTVWDGAWRLVIYDVPERHKNGRNALTAKLGELGFYQLQRSAWLHPFPCRKTIEIVTSKYGIDSYVTYLKTSHIDNQKVLVDRFSKKYSRVKFK